MNISHINGKNDFHPIHPHTPEDLDPYFTKITQKLAAFGTQYKVQTQVRTLTTAISNLVAQFPPSTTPPFTDTTLMLGIRTWITMVSTEQSPIWGLSANGQQDLSAIIPIGPPSISDVPTLAGAFYFASFMMQWTKSGDCGGNDKDATLLGYLHGAIQKDAATSNTNLTNYWNHNNKFADYGDIGTAWGNEKADVQAILTTMAAGSGVILPPTNPT